MATVTPIEWTDRTWNPVRGCSVISPGCVNCYAMKTAHRYSAPGLAYDGLTKRTAAGPQWTGEVLTVEHALVEPLKWKTPARIFVNSMSDLFHEAVPDAFIDQVFATMALAHRHTFQILTKRANRMREYCSRRPNGGENQFVSLAGYGSTSVLWGRPDLRPWPLPNVWLGVSVENQRFADERIPLLLQTPAAVRFVSAEPLLGPVNLRSVGTATCGDCRDALHVMAHGEPSPRLDWVIVGGESGPGARPFDINWARSIAGQCRAAGVPVFVKQLGARAVGLSHRPEHISLVLKDRKGGNMAEWPEDLRVRQFPAVRA